MGVSLLRIVQSLAGNWPDYTIATVLYLWLDGKMRLRHCLNAQSKALAYAKITSVFLYVTVLGKFFLNIVFMPQAKPLLELFNYAFVVNQLKLINSTDFLADRIRISEILRRIENLILPMLSYPGRQVASSCENAS